MNSHITCLFLTVFVLLSYKLQGEGATINPAGTTKNHDDLFVRGPKILYECPSGPHIAPCECFHPSQVTLTLKCNGELVTQADIQNAFKMIRQVNSIQPDTWLDMNTIEIQNTLLTHLDLSAFYRTRVYPYFTVYNNTLLTSLSDPPSHDYVNSIRAYVISFNIASLSRDGIGQALAFFDPRAATALAFAYNKIQSPDFGEDIIWGLSNFTELDSLYLARNKLTRIGGGQFRKMNRLYQLRLSENNLTEIGNEAFIIDEPLEETENTFFIINLDNNQIKDGGVNNEYSGVLNVTTRPITLGFDSNNFEFISAEQFENFLRGNDRSHMSLLHNPLICDERMRWLKDDGAYFEKHVHNAFCSNDPGQTVFNSTLV